MNKLLCPSPKYALCQVWLKLAHWFWRRRFFKFVNVFSKCCNYLPLKKGVALHLNKLESPKPKDKDNNNDDDNDNDDIDDGQQTNFDQKSSLEPSAQLS